MYEKGIVISKIRYAHGGRLAEGSFFCGTIRAEKIVVLFLRLLPKDRIRAISSLAERVRISRGF